MPRRALRKLAIAVLGITLPTLTLLVVSEGIFRLLLFSKVGFMEKFRAPDLYFDHDSEDNYWKLQYLFDEKVKPPANPHPVLGWVGGDFSGETYLHNEAANIRGRHVVLLYGDSFAACATIKEECFQGILNADSEFAKMGYLINYGVGGYGVDQMFLLLKNSLHHFQDPFVIVSLMTYDVDRSTLSVRIGQKPYFELGDGKLVLRGTPINADPNAFFAQNPPTIPSYLFRLWVQGTGWPQRVSQYFRGTDEIRKKRILINEKLLFSIIQELRQKRLQHIFVVFYPDRSLLDENWEDWRERFIERVLGDNHIPYISTKEIVKKHLSEHHGSLEDYYIKGDGHPTAYQNKLLADVMKKVVLDAIGDK